MIDFLVNNLQYFTTALLVYCGYKIYIQHKIIQAQGKLLVLLQVSQYIMEQIWEEEEEEKKKKKKEL